MLAETMMSQLASFGKTDLMQIRQLTDMLLGSNAAPETPINDDREAMLFDAVKAELSSSGFNGKIPYNTLKESNYYKSWCKGLGVVNQFIEEHFQHHIRNKIDRIALCRIIVQVLMQDLRRLGVPPSLGTLARNMQRVPQAFDNQFPNYIQSGLAHLVIKAMQKRK